MRAYLVAGGVPHGRTESVYVDLGSRATFDRVRLFPRDDKECEGYGFPIDFTIQGSYDATRWKILLTRTNFNGGAPLSAPVRAQLRMTNQREGGSATTTSRL